MPQSASQIEAIIKMPRPTNVEELCASLGITGCLRQYTKEYSVITAPLTSSLCNKAFGLKRARKTPMKWGKYQGKAFVRLKEILLSPLVFTFLSWNHPFTVHIDVISVGAVAVLAQIIDGKTLITSFASHRISKWNAAEGPAEKAHRCPVCCRTLRTISSSPTLHAGHRQLRTHVAVP